jgi:putative flippase GtrA
MPDPILPINRNPSEDHMLRLGFILHLFIGSTLAGSAVIAALVMGQDTLTPILIAALIGFVAAFPVTYLVTKKLLSDS